MVSGDQDAFGPVANLREIFHLAAEPKQFVLIEGADHFFQGKLPMMQQAISDWLIKQFPSVTAAQRA